MRRKIRVKELCTPCAGHRPGAADPIAQQSCVPATAPRTKIRKAAKWQSIRFVVQTGKDNANKDNANDNLAFAVAA